MPFTYLYIEDNFVPDIVTDQFRRKKIGVGITLKEGEKMDDAINEAEQFIKEYIQKNTLTPQHFHIEEKYIPESELPVFNYKEVVETLREQTLEEQIRSCKEINVLKAYQLLVKKDPILQKAYNDTMDAIQFHKM